MDTIRIGLIGCGGIMRLHIRRLNERPEAQIVALCDVNEEALAGYRDKHFADADPKPAIFTDRAKMYAESNLDAVFIASPHTLHYEQACEALDAGCHIFMEKPMVTDAAQARDLAARVEKAGKIFVVGYNTPCSPRFEYLRDVIADQRFGKLELVSAYISQDWKRFTTGSWRQDPKLSGGGQAYDSGAHLLNSLCWSINQNVEAVHAMLDHCGTPVDINSAMTIKFTNGTLASVAISGNSPGAGRYAAFMFERGRIEIDAWSAGWMKVFESDGKGGDTLLEIELPEGSDNPDHNFLDAIQGKAKPRTSPQNGIIHSDLMDAIYESARTGKVARPRQ